MDDTQDPIEELGPVDYLVIEFPEGEQNFSPVRPPTSWQSSPRPASSASSTC